MSRREKNKVQEMYERERERETVLKERKAVQEAINKTLAVSVVAYPGIRL